MTNHDTLVALLRSVHQSCVSVYGLQNPLTVRLGNALGLAEKTRDDYQTISPATPEEVVGLLDSLVPGSQLRDAEGDLWRKTKKGNWRLQVHNEKVVVRSKNIVHAWGPVRIQPWEGPK